MARSLEGEDASVKPLLVCGNWKMHTDRAGAKALAAGVASAAIGELAGSLASAIEMVVFPPAPFLADVAGALEGSGVACGGQGCHPEPQGAFTGAISAAMVASTGCGWVLCGHSERRRIFGETNEGVGARLRAALGAGLQPILCVGETLEEREGGRTHEVVATQLRHALEGIGVDEAGRIAIAYEPVWAIGTGRTATVEQAREVHRAIRGFLPGPVAESVRILYGGSVKPGNARELMSAGGIDGVLVGGASLTAEGFCAIARAGAEAYKDKVGGPAEGVVAAAATEPEAAQQEGAEAPGGA
jgi:triosephosphate isomerase